MRFGFLLIGILLGIYFGMCLSKIDPRSSSLPVKSYCVREETDKGSCNPNGAMFCAGSNGTFCIESKVMEFQAAGGVVIFNGSHCDQLIKNNCNL